MDTSNGKAYTWGGVLKVEVWDSIPAKTVIAYRYTVERFRRYCDENNQDMYFWTFTFPYKMPDWRYSYLWEAFATWLRDRYRDELVLYGIKVVERHPGGHGLHYHAVINHRICIHELKRVARRFGMGEVMWVERVKSRPGVGMYLEKYLEKDFGHKFYPGIRRWSTFGGFPSVRVQDVVLDTPITRALKRFVDEVYHGQIPFRDMVQIVDSQNITNRDHLDYCVWYAKEHKKSLLPLTWSWHRLELEMGLPNNPYDGRCPF